MNKENEVKGPGLQGRYGLLKGSKDNKRRRYGYVNKTPCGLKWGLSR